MLQRRTLGFLGARELAFFGATSKDARAMCYEPSLWRALYERSHTLNDFVSAEELLSGAHLTGKSNRKLGLLTLLLRDDEEEHRRRVVLEGNNWHRAFALCTRHENIVRQLQAARRKRPFDRTRRMLTGWLGCLFRSEVTVCSCSLYSRCVSAR